MKKISIIIFVVGFFIPQIFGQDLKHETLKWNHKPRIHPMDEKYKDESAVIIQDYRYVDNAIDEKYRKAFTYYTEHKIIRVNNDAGIEKFNKLYIRLGSEDKLVMLNVRTISPDNEEKSFSKENLKQLSNIDGYSSDYKIFAVEGIVKGGEIEYIYTIRQPMKPYGREYFQSDTPTLDALFELTSPKGFIFASRSYNGLPDAILSNDRKTERVSMENIPAFTDDGFAAYRSQLMRVDYKLMSNPAQRNIFSWSKISGNMFDFFRDSRGSKHAGKFLKKLNLKSLTKEQKVMIVENAIKHQFSVKDSGEEEYSDVNSVFLNKVGNDVGLTRIFIKCLEQLKVDYQIILTTSRFRGQIEKDFAHNMDLQEILLFLPSFNKYISPSNLFMRFGPPTNVLAGNKALFIKTKLVAGTESRYAGHDIRELPHLDPNENNVGVNAEIRINDSLDGAEIKHEHFSQGYEAYPHRFYYSLGDEEALEEYKKNTITSAIEDAEFKSFELENEDMQLSSDIDSYFKVHSTFTSQSLVEKAGNDILVSIGKVIGKQMEMYDQKDRMSPIILQNVKRYSHNIKLYIPDGYECKGLEQISIDNKVLRNTETVMRFISKYTLKDNVLEITINEDYDVIDLESKYFQDYRSVINSAADFNKIVLVLEPK